MELLSRAVAAGAGLVVRACRSKRRRVLCEDGSKKGLWNHMAEQPVLTRRSLNLAACGGKRARKKREVTLDIRAARVRLVPPGDRTGDAPLSMLAVSVAGPQGLDWLLLTTEGKPEKDDAVRVVKWYERRWTEYFKALKSGMGIEDRRFDDADDLRKCLAFDAITACRVFDFQRMARDRPDAPAAEVADEDEIAVLYLAERGMVKSRPPPENLDVRTFVVDVGRLAGFIPTPALARDHLAGLRLPQGLRSNIQGATEQRHAQGLDNGGMKAAARPDRYAAQISSTIDSEASATSATSVRPPSNTATSTANRRRSPTSR